MKRVVDYYEQLFLNCGYYCVVRLFCCLLPLCSIPLCSMTRGAIAQVRHYRIFANANTSWLLQTTLWVD